MSDQIPVYRPKALDPVAGSHFSGEERGCPLHPFDTWRNADGALFCNRADCVWTEPAALDESGDHAPVHAIVPLDIYLGHIRYRRRLAEWLGVEAA